VPGENPALRIPVAHNPSDAMDRLLRVAVAGVGTLVSLGICGFGVMMIFGSRGSASGGAELLGWIIAAAGAAGFLGFGGRTLFLVMDWRRNRGDRSNRP
jgi:hypothetical protein